MPGELHIDLVGVFRLEYDGKQVTTVNTYRLQELLTWLILHREAPQSRQHLAFLFWPDSTEKQALRNLRNLLHQLRNALPEADRFLTIDHNTLQWNLGADFTLDVAEFEAALDSAEEAKREEDSSRQESALTEAISYYKGPLLPDCYAEWIEQPRERLQQAYRNGLQEVVELLERRRDYTAAIGYAREWIQSEPYNEPAWRRLIELYARNDDRANALQTYKECVELLREDLDNEPAPETQLLFERLVRGPTDTRPPKESTVQEHWPLVGREKEWETLQTCWKTALSGNMQGLLITGDAGIGKSRLGLEFLNTLQKQGYTVAYSRCYEVAGTLSYAPVIDWLHEESVQKQLRDLDPVWMTELVRLMPELLIDQPDLTLPGPITESWHQRQLFEAISRALLSGDKPMLLFLDDLQWCDAKSLEWVSHLFHNHISRKLMLVGAFRPAEANSNEYVQKLIEDLSRRGRLQVVPLGELDEEETGELASQVADRPIELETARRLYQETEGHPLFVVEAVREGHWMDAGSGVQTGNLSGGNGSGHPLPKKVNDVISTRFQRLSKQSRKLMGVAAVIGRQFTLDTLRQTGELEQPEFIEAVEELLQAHIIRQQRSGGYDLSHDKLREVAYSELSDARKQWLHERVAGAIETVYAGNLKGLQGRLAYHYERAGHNEKATIFYEQATEEARQILTDLEAAGYLDRSQNLLEQFRKTESDETNEPQPHRNEKDVEPVQKAGVYQLIRVKKTPGKSKSITTRLLFFSGLLVTFLILFMVGQRYIFTGPTWEIDSIAVLPLVNLSGDPGQEYFSEGMHDAIIGELARIGALRVISRTSTMHYKETKKHLPEIARELGVDAVVEGSVYRDADQVRITVQLIHEQSDRHLWAQSYQRELRGILALQGEIARDIAQHIRVTLTSEKAARTGSARLVNPAAYDAYLRGIFFQSRGRAGDLRRAETELQRAIQLDPLFADAFARLAMMYAGVGYMGSNSEWPQGPEDAFTAATAAVTRALELNPSLPEANLALGIILLTYNRDPGASERALRYAIELDPSLADAHSALGTVLAIGGHYDAAIAAVKRALELDPRGAARHGRIAWAHWTARRYDDAIRLAQEAIALHPTTIAYHALGFAYVGKARYTEALEAFENAYVSSNENRFLLSNLGYAYALSGRTEEARRILTEMLELYRTGLVSPYLVAQIYMGLGERDSALSWLETTYDEGHAQILFLNANPGWEPLRSEPRFQALLRKVGLE